MSRLMGNGAGSIMKVKNKKGYAYRVRVSLGTQLDMETGKAKVIQKSLGTFKTRKEAEMALSQYHLSPYSLDNTIKTFGDLYEAWSREYFDTLKNDSSIRTVKSAYAYCDAIKNVDFRTFNGGMLERFVNNAQRINSDGSIKKASSGTKARVKSLLNLTLDFAVKNGLINYNEARRFNISKEIRKDIEANKKVKEAFSEAQIEKMWQFRDTVPFTDMVLIGIYTGFRPQELATIPVSAVHLDENYIRHGMKTESGYDRYVPIHPRIKPLVEKYYTEATELYQSNMLFNNPQGQQGMAMTYDKYRGIWQKVMATFKFEGYTGHCQRVTFATRAYRFGLDKYAIKRIMGHKPSSQDLLESVYTRISDDDLQREMAKIEY